MKLAEVIPIFKKDNRDKTTNYRPISLLSQFNKIFEKLFYVRIYSYLIKYNLLSDHQFGFRKNCFTTLAISKIYDEVLNNTDQGLYSCCIFLDLRKAFDTVVHEILLQKQENFGIRGNAIELMRMRSYLTDRHQYTRIENFKSAQKKLTVEFHNDLRLDPYCLYYTLMISL